METKKTTGLDLLFPIILGTFSIAGILIVLLLGTGNKNNQNIPATNTSYSFVYLGTEPGISTLTPVNTSTAIILSTSTLTQTSVVTLRPNTSTPSSTSSGPTSTVAPTSTATIPFVQSKLDDNSPVLIYSGGWSAETNVGGAHQGTLHVSSTVGNTVNLTFMGQQLTIGYQPASSLGRIMITIDGLSFEVDQSDANYSAWSSQLLIVGNHTVIVEHLSGGSVNLDYVTIPDVATVTPSATATSTDTLTPTP